MTLKKIINHKKREQKKGRENYKNNQRTIEKWQ